MIPSNTDFFCKDGTLIIYLFKATLLQDLLKKKNTLFDGLRASFNARQPKIRCSFFSEARKPSLQLVSEKEKDGEGDDHKD